MRLNILPKTEEDSRDTPISTKSGSRNDRESKNLISKLCEPRTPRKCLKKAPKMQLKTDGPGDRRETYCRANRRRNPHGRPCLKSNPGYGGLSVLPLMIKGLKTTNTTNGRRSGNETLTSSVLCDENLDFRAANAYQPALSSDLVSCI